MFNYIIKRLIVMLITLFGITVITFIVTRLAPGDPAALKLQFGGQKGPGGSAMTKKLIEETRRIYGFDKPMILNLQDQNYKTEADKIVQKLEGTDLLEREDARLKIREISSLALPSIFERLNSSDVKNKEIFREEALNILPSIVHPSLLTNSGETTAALSLSIDEWKSWWNKNKSYYLDMKSSAIYDALQNPDKEQMHATILSYGGFAAKHLAKRLLDIGEKSAKEGREDSVVITSLLSQIVKKPWDMAECKTPEERADYYERWKRWWKNDKVAFTTFSPIVRFTRIFTATQYGVWMGKILTFDFDVSYYYNKPVIQLIKERLPISLQLSLISIFLSYIIAIPLGIYSATHRYSKTDQTITVFMFILYSLPSFWVASMLIMFTTGGDFPNIFPSRYLHSIGYESFPFWKRMGDWAWHLVLPITCYTYASFAFLSRQMRTSMLESIKQDYIRTARAKGLPERVVIFKHALRNSLIPILTLSASILPELLSGGVIIEQIFSINGMGKLTFEAILNRDYPVINGIFFFSALLTLLGILLADLSYAAADPRITYD